MPIPPPNLDDRQYADVVREARTLIPQYCPEWTNLGDADPGMTLVQLFAWMTEMIIYRLNRVPDKTYIHFLNFIGEERREARPARVPVTFEVKGDHINGVEIPSYTRCSTRPQENGQALHFLTTEPITVNDCNIQRMVSVRASRKPMVRELSSDAHPACQKALLFGNGSGVQVFKMDEIEHGPKAYTPFQYLYVSHDDFRRMIPDPDNPMPVGRMRIRSADENLPVGTLFRWEYYLGEELGWVPVPANEEDEQVLGLPEVALKTELKNAQQLDYLGQTSDPIEMPEQLQESKYWIRGTVDYERWLAHRMQEDLEITWRDDRGGEERMINNWDVRDTGRYLEFFIQDMPPIRPGWVVRFTLVDRSISAGGNAYIPRYKWTYRRGNHWEEIPSDRVRYQGTVVILTGPFIDMANDGFNLRAERVETVNVRSFIKDLNLQLTWIRPITVNLAFGPETGASLPQPTWELPFTPFQTAMTLPPLLGMKMFMGTDLLENRAGKSVVMEIEFGFELDGKLVEEPKEQYEFQLTYRASDSWRVVYSKDELYNACTFATLDSDDEGYLRDARRKVRIEMDPKKQLRGLHRSNIAGRETCWLRLEMMRSALSFVPDKKKGTPPIPYVLKIFAVKFGVKGAMGLDSYEEPMPGPKIAHIAYRNENRRLSRVVTRAAGKMSESYPFDRFIDISDGDEENDGGHTALYFKYDKPFPMGLRHSMTFKIRGESYLPEGVTSDWEILESTKKGRVKWGRLTPCDDQAGSHDYLLNRTGSLDFTLDKAHEAPEEGTWIRAILRMPKGEDLPPLPPLTHIMLNTVDGVNLHSFRMEKFSGFGVPQQTIQLRHFPVYVANLESAESDSFDSAEFPDMRIYVVEDDKVRREWRRAPGNSMLTATKDDRVFMIDPVEGTLTFGNGIRGKILPVGNYNITVEVYHVIPGKVGNVSGGAIIVAEGFNDVVDARNLLPATGGRNSETIGEIIRRAPSILTSRDRAVTRLDFEVIAKEASAEVARAACDGKLSSDGKIGVVVLPHRRDKERVPDPFLSAGLKEHVRRYLAKRCLVNVEPIVRLADFKEVDVSLTLRLRPSANMIAVREKAQSWVARFLDPYVGGIEGAGWPFSGTLYAQDFGRIVSAIPEIRHVVDVTLYGVGGGNDKEFPGWEKGQGSQVISLTDHDLFVIRMIRVMSEDGEQ
jgi:hypothetical protein